MSIKDELDNLESSFFDNKTYDEFGEHIQTSIAYAQSLVFNDPNNKILPVLIEQIKEDIAHMIGLQQNETEKYLYIKLYLGKSHSEYNIDDLIQDYPSVHNLICILNNLKTSGVNYNISIEEINR